MYSMDIFNLRESEIQDYFLMGQAVLGARLRSHECFDPYLSYQKFGNTLISGFPQDTHLEEFFTACRNVGLVPRFLPADLVNTDFPRCKFAVYWEYPVHLNERQKYVLDYLLHQFIRIPTIAHEHDIEAENYQDMLERVCMRDPYWSFNVRFNYRDVLERIEKTPDKISSRQTALVMDILYPVAAEISGRYIASSANLELVLLAQRYREELFLELTREERVPYTKSTDTTWIKVVPCI